MKSRIIGVSIAVPAAAVYDFASNPANLPLWVPSFCHAVEFIDGVWVVQSPEGPAVFTFVESNPHGVLDHTVRLESGMTFTNPMRVVPHGSGCEVLFTLFQQHDMSDERFEEDARMVHSDLETLRGILEGR